MRVYSFIRSIDLNIYRQKCKFGYNQDPMKRILFILLAFFGSFTISHAQNYSWEQCKWLIGDWVGDGDGKPRRDESGRIVRTFFKPSSPEEPNAAMPWYRGSGNSGTDLGHAWFIGFAPARDPKIAFAVLVEYGGAGGRDAGPVAQAILEACIEHGYLPTSSAGR